MSSHKRGWVASTNSLESSGRIIVITLLSICCSKFGNYTLYYRMLLKDVGNYALAKRPLEYALHYEPPMKCWLIVIDDMECNKVVDETIVSGCLPCGCIFKFWCSVACMEDSKHDSSRL
jgi:hypothetical protein